MSCQTTHGRDGSPGKRSVVGPSNSRPGVGKRSVDGDDDYKDLQPSEHKILGKLSDLVGCTKADVSVVMRKLNAKEDVDFAVDASCNPDAVQKMFGKGHRLQKRQAECTWYIGCIEYFCYINGQYHTCYDCYWICG